MTKKRKGKTMIKYVLLFKVANGKIVASTYSAFDMEGALESQRRMITKDTKIVGIIEYNHTSPAMRIKCGLLG